MSEPPRRKRFQIHLSTAIVMMFVAGVLIWANTEPLLFGGLIMHPRGVIQEIGPYYGWPFSISKQNLLSEHVSVRLVQYWFAFDVLLVLVVLGLLWVVCEWLIGRRAARKGA